mgnify:CR=1 FL=1
MAFAYSPNRLFPSSRADVAMRLIPLVGIALFAQVAGEAFAVVATVEVQSGRSFEGEILRRTD